MAKKKQNGFRPKLRSNNDYFETASAFQKYLRRCDAEKALHFAQDLFFSGYHKYVWKRLALVWMEDIGFADINIIPESLGYYMAYKTNVKRKKEHKKFETLAWLATSNAIRKAAYAMKNRMVDNAKIWAMKSGLREELLANDTGKRNDGLLQSLQIALHSASEKVSLIYAHTHLREFPADVKQLFDALIEVSLTATPDYICNVVNSARFIYDEVLAEKKEHHLPLSFIVMVIARNAQVQTEQNEMAKKAMTLGYECRIPEFAIDFHTARGKHKGLKYFITEGSKIERESKQEGEDFYWDFAKKYFTDYDNGNVTERGYQAKDEPQQNLFG